MTRTALRILEAEVAGSLVPVASEGLVGALGSTPVGSEDPAVRVNEPTVPTGTEAPAPSWRATCTRGPPVRQVLMACRIRIVSQDSWQQTARSFRQAIGLRKSATSARCSRR